MFEDKRWGIPCPTNSLKSEFLLILLFTPTSNLITDDDNEDQKLGKILAFLLF